MKIRTNKTPAHGSALIVTLMTATIIGIALASYLTVITHQNRSTMQSLAWNTCIPVSEAGVEEALTQIHYRGISNLTANGWTEGADGFFRKTRSIGADGSYFQVTIEPVNPPVIVSVGFVPALVSASSQFGMIQTPSQASPTYVSRSLRVQTTARGRFNTAMLAKGNITFSGSARTDSFDSTNPNFSANGKYDPTKARDKGDVASNGTVASTFVGSGQININGRLSTGPGGAYDLNGESSIGSTAWHQAGHTGVEDGWASEDMNVEIPDVEVPFTSGYSTPAAGTIDGTSYKYVLGSGNYKLSQLVLGLSQKLIVTGDAVLYVTDTLSMSGASQIFIAPGARLQLYNGAATASIGGNGVANQSGSAANFIYYGLPTNTRLDMNGSSGFIGAIYAPNADFTLSGGSSDGLIEFTGASVSKTVTMSGGRSFHYDESLAKLFQDFVVAAWNEI